MNYYLWCRVLRMVLDWTPDMVCLLVRRTDWGRFGSAWVTFVVHRWLRRSAWGCPWGMVWSEEREDGITSTICCPHDVIISDYSSQRAKRTDKKEPSNTHIPDRHHQHTIAREPGDQQPTTPPTHRPFPFLGPLWGAPEEVSADRSSAPHIYCCYRQPHAGRRR